VTESVKSEKSYSTAVILSGIFGIFGIHHFYCGRILHGFFDLSLAIVGLTLMLLVGSYRDGHGKLIAYPGQKI